jgi:hypothetical protein
MKIWYPWQLKKSKAWGPFLVNGQRCLAGSSKMAPQDFKFFNCLGAEYGHNNSFLGSVIYDIFYNQNFQNPLENGGKEEGNSRTKSVETLESDVFHERKATVLDLFRPTLMLFRSTNMFYQWFSVTMCYYGLSFASVNLLGDPYTNAALSYFIEIPGKY